MCVYIYILHPNTLENDFCFIVFCYNFISGEFTHILQGDFTCSLALGQLYEHTIVPVPVTRPCIVRLFVQINPQITDNISTSKQSKQNKQTNKKSIKNLTYSMGDTL